jgi:hypothetical protein
LTRNFSFSGAHDMIDLRGSLAYQFAAAFSSGIAASYDIRHFQGSSTMAPKMSQGSSDSPKRRDLESCFFMCQ